MKYIYKIWLISIAIFLILAAPASAITYGGVGGRPANPDPDVPNSQAWFIYGLKGGEAHEDGLVVQNATETAVRVAVYPADSTPSSDGGFALKQRVEEMQGVGSWIKLYPDDPPAASPDIISDLHNGSEPESILARCALLELGENSGESVTSVLQNNLGRSLNAAETAYVEQLATWCLGKTEYKLDLEPGQLTLVPFVISMPDEVDVGEHTGGLLVEKLAIDTGSEGGGLRLTTRVGVRVYETVPGEIIRQASVSDFSIFDKSEPGVYNAAFSLENLGNVSIDGEATLYISPSFLGGPVEPISREVQILRGDTLTTNFEWPPSTSLERPKPGTYVAYAEFSYYDGEQTQVIISDSVKLSLIPWPTIILVLSLFILLILVLVFAIRHRRKMYDASGWVKYRVKTGENLEDIAERTKVSWKQIALANKLPKPYTLKDGESILVPLSAKTRRKVPVAAKLKQKSHAGPAKLRAGSNRRQIIWARTIIAIMAGVVVIVLVVISLPKEKSSDLESQQRLDKIVEESNGPAAIPDDLGQEAVQEQMEDLFEAREDARQATATQEIIFLPQPKDITVQILNGSGTPGEAGKLAERLRLAGYVIDHIGNAERFDYTDTMLYYSDGSEDKAVVLEEFLTQLGLEVTLDERETQGDLVTVIIGQE